jgi:4-hydroxybenzoate polyprenyltransferase
MSNKSDKPLALKTIFGSLAAVIAVYILLATFSHQVAGNFKNAIYVTGVIIFGIVFLLCSFWAYDQADDNNDNKSRAFVIGLAVVIILWAGGWVVGSNEKVAPGSPQMEDVR